VATALIDLSILERNLAILEGLLQPETSVLATVKADAYGHGAVRVATALQKRGVDWFGVSTAQELLELRSGGIRGDILLFTPALDSLHELADAGTVFTVADAASLERLAAARLPAGTRVHLKVDTGNGRLGLPVPEALQLARRVDRTPGLILEGVWTHFSSAEETDRSVTLRQLELFTEFLQLLKRDGLEPPLRHCSNSAALLAFPEAHFDLVRPGILLYGYPPASNMKPPEGLLPPLTLLAPVLMSKRVAAGTPISYNRRWHAPRDTNILTVRCGYADGYGRSLGNRAWAALKGRRLEVVGQVAMDQMMLDAADLLVQPGELVTLMGGAGPGADELGTLAGTNAYEMLVSLSDRVVRQYVRSGVPLAETR
jgi:alanine racemase